MRALDAWHRAALWARRRFGPWLGLLEQFSPRRLQLPPEYLRVEPLANAPVISIVTPSFNQGKYLERTLESVLNQDYAPLEYIVQDGGSSDATAEILARYKDRLFHVESAPDGGQAHALNLGFARSTGEIMAYLNSDDILLPGTLHQVARFFVERPGVDVVYGHRIVINDRDEEIGRWILPPHSASSILWNNYIPQETMFWRRRIWEKAGELDESFRSTLDWDLILRFHRAGATFHRIPRFLAAFRIHPEQKTEILHQNAGLPEQRRLRERTHGRAVSRAEGWVRVLPYLAKSIVYHRLYQAGILSY